MDTNLEYYRSLLNGLKKKCRQGLTAFRPKIKLITMLSIILNIFNDRRIQIQLPIVL
ncbi:hypothetical protein EV197_0087 [Aquimarina brevivitae]|uniref:Uncharacterized protein n=1 Tax=Aquimarina brevivitae TaxID=323412 RepID=A0A4Q7PEN5_9FLAO|nr:hypothetical protein EV197_0087 [Aquimarina brevivitae]